MMIDPLRSSRALLTAPGRFPFSLAAVAFGGHVRLVFTLVLFIYIVCVSATITSFAELPLDVLEMSQEKVFNNWTIAFNFQIRLR